MSLVCLHKTPQGMATAPEEGEIPDLEVPPDASTVRRLLDCAVSVSDPRVVKHFAAMDPPSAWQREAHLRFHRRAVFEGGHCRCEGFDLLLDPLLGLSVEAQEGGEAE